MIIKSSRFDERFSIRIGKRGDFEKDRHNRYINTDWVHPPDAASSLFWAEFDSKGEPTGVSGEIIDNCQVVLTGGYMRRRVREAYANKIEFLSHNRGRYRFRITLPDGSFA